MKYKILSCLLAISAMLSVQAVIIINSTSIDITLDKFEIEEEKVEDEKNDTINQDSIQLQAHKHITFGKEINSMNIVINGESYQLCNLNLTSDTRVIVIEWNEKFEFLTNDGSVTIKTL